MGGRFKEIKETASDAVEIIRELGSPDVQESLDKVNETTKTVKEIMEAFKQPQMVKNIENILAITQTMQNVSSKLENVTLELKKTGIMDETSQAIKSARSTMDSLGNSQNLGETSVVIKEMLKSITDLVNELKLVVLSSSKSGTVRNIEELVHEASGTYSNVAGEVRAARNKKSDPETDA